MSTSLSRQLESLKSRTNDPGIVADKSHPLFLSDGSLDSASISAIAKKSFEELKSELIPEIKIFESSLFPDDGTCGNNDLQVNLVDILPLLSPYFLRKEPQWILQHLFTNHSFHLIHPDQIFFVLLPYYDYKVFSSILPILSEVSSDSSTPNLIARFKSACFPTSQFGLIRHLASDLGFFKFLTENYLNYQKKYGVKNEGNFSKVCHFVVSHVLSALNNCSKVSEIHTHSLIQIVVGGMKSCNAEFRAGADVLISFLLPRVTLSSKAANRILKLIVKSSIRSRESLSLLILLARSQNAVLDKINLAKNFVKHENVILKEIFCGSSGDYGSVLVDTLALVLLEIPYVPFTETLHDLLALILNVLSRKCSPSKEAAKAIISQVSNIFTEMKNEDGSSKNEEKTLCKKLLNILSTEFPFESSKYSCNKISTEADIFIMDEENVNPTDDQISAKRILLDNVFVGSTFCSEFLSNKEVQEDIESNVNSILQVLSQGSKFLTKQMESTSLVHFLWNCLKYYYDSSKIIETTIDILTSKILIQDPDIYSYIQESLDCLLLPYFFVSNTKNILAKSYYVTDTNSKLKVFYKCLKEQDVWEKLSEYPIQTLLKLKDILKSPGLLSIIFSSYNSTFSFEHLQEILNLLLFVAESGMSVYENKCSSPVALIFSSVSNNFLPMEIIENMLKEMLTVKDQLSNDKFILILRTLVLISSKFKGNRALQCLLGEFIRAWSLNQSVPYEEAMSYILTLSTNDKVKGVSRDIKIMALVEISNVLESNQKVMKKFLSTNRNGDSDSMLPIILSQLTENSSKIRKKVIEVLEIIKNKMVSITENFLPLVIHILDRKFEIESDKDNIKCILSDIADQNLIISFVNSLCLCPPHIFVKGITLVPKTFEKLSSICEYSSKEFLSNSGAVSEQIIKWFFPQMVPELQSNTEYWNFFIACLKSDTLSVLAIESLEASVKNIQNPSNFFSSFIDLIGISSLPGAVMAGIADKVLDRLTDSIKIKTFIEKLIDIWTKEFFYSNNLKSIKSFSDRCWDSTLFLLEILLRKSSLDSECIRLINLLFQLLRYTLYYENEEAQYTIDLLLSTILHVIESLNEEELRKINAIDPELIVNCIRSSKIPSTKSTALLILAKASACNPDYVLHNSIPIFTFMGNHFVKMDSKHSFDVALRAIDIIIPHLKSACGNNEEKLKSMSIKIVTTFADASEDIPKHRLRPFLNRLLTLLGQTEYLWIFTLQSLRKIIKKIKKQQTLIIQLIELFETFDVGSQIGSILHILIKLREFSTELKSLCGLSQTDDFKLLRLCSMNFISHLLGSKGFRSQIKAFTDKVPDPPELKLLMECILVNLEIYTSEHNDNEKIAKLTQNQSEKLLECCLNILTDESLELLIGSLLVNSKESVKRKALEVLNSKLNSQIKSSDISLLDPLMGLIENSKESEYVCQMSLLAIRSLAQISGSTFPEEFKNLLKKLTDKNLLKKLDSPNVIASNLLCITEIFSSIGPRAVSYLSTFVKWILKLLNSPEQEVVLNSLVLSVQKLVENFGGFLHPFYQKLIFAIVKLDKTENRRLRLLLSTLAQGVPSDTLINIVRSSLDDVSSPKVISEVLGVLRENVSSLNKKDALALSPDFMDLFSFAFYKFGSEEFSEVEEDIINTFLALGLKLSLDDFKPLFYRIFNAGSGYPSTLFRFTYRVAEKLKSLFSFVAESVVRKGVKAIDELSLPNVDKESLRTLSYVLETFTAIFSYNKAETVLCQTYEESVNSILRFYDIENQDCGIIKKLNECINSLSNSTDDDSSWKYLHYQILLKLRSYNAQIRMGVLSLMESLVIGRGDSYMSVLPDAVPFLVETLEDEDKDVEKRTKALIMKMEDVFGQSIDSYFEM